MKNQCPVCKNECEVLQFRAFDGKGSFKKVCSKVCAISFEQQSNDIFVKNLGYYRELHEQIKSLSQDDEKYLHIQNELDVLEHLHGFTKNMLV